MMRTTCVATLLQAGHASNALPQLAQANVSCRILPGHSLEEIRQDLSRVFDDPRVAVGYKDEEGKVFDPAPDRKQLPPPPLNPKLMAAVEKLAAAMWPGTSVVPTLDVAASDGVHTNAAGMPTYGISGIALETNDYRAHGNDERVPVESYYRGFDFYYQLVKMRSDGD